MEKKKTKKPVKKETAAKKPEAVSPFAERVEPKEAVKMDIAVKKPRVFKVAAKVEVPVAAEEKEVVKRTRKKGVEIDPFAEVATATSTVKKAATPTKVKKKRAATKAVKKKKPNLDITPEIAAAEPQVELSPVFKALADVSLPPLQKEDRARLLMQSPTKAYFYWSLRENPWGRLRKVFGDSVGSYTLVIKLSDLTNETDTFYPADTEGERWFDVEPGIKYSAEIGFYATNRPYFRIVYSNTIEMPRRSPSPHPASDARWTVSATKFAEVLDVSGFSRDAFDVAMAGDDAVGAADATNLAFSSLVGGGDYSHFAAEDVRYALLSIAAGVEMNELESRVSRRLFETLQSSGKEITPERSRAALSEYFDIDDAEWTEEYHGPAVYGSSLVHFPPKLKTRKVASTYKPVSSHSIR